MPEIAATPKNGLRVISTFSGCGGSCLGFEMAGYTILAASEFVEAARDTYRANHPGVPVDERDIRTVEAGALLDLAGVGPGEIDVLEGSPPCSSFSTAGKGSKHWGEQTAYSGTIQRTDDLFFEFARLVEGIRPRVFVAENVSGLVKGDSKGYFKLFYRRLRDAGYRLESRMLDAQWLGVPQRRRRIIFVGVREDLGRDPAWPAPLPYRYTIAEAIGRSGPVIGHGRDYAFERMDIAPTIQAIKTATDLVAITDSEYQADPETGEALRIGRTKVHEAAARVLANDIGHNQKIVRGAAPTVTVVAKDLVIENVDGLTHDPETGSRIDLTGTEAGDSYARVIARSGPQFSSRVETIAPTILNMPEDYTIETADGIVNDPETGERIDITGTAIGRAYGRLRPGDASEKYMNLVRPNVGDVSATVTAIGGQSRGVASVVHPGSPRKFTLAELRRICGFPDDFVLTGSYSQRWERLGRAVPPPMMYAIANALIPVLAEP